MIVTAEGTIYLSLPELDKIVTVSDTR